MKSLIFEKIWQQESSYFFQKIIEQRELQIKNLMIERGRSLPGNLAETFGSFEAKIIIKNEKLPNLPDIYSKFEREAINVFGNILNAWTEFEINKYKKRVENEYLKDYVKQSEQLNLFGVRSQIVNDISIDHRFFFIQGLRHPARLKNAVVLCNLFQFIKAQKWYEMLYTLELSSKGQHFIYYNASPDSLEIIATGLITDYRERRNWLTFSEFFQSGDWPALLDKKQLQLFFKDEEIELGINFSNLANEFSNVADFERQFLKSIIDPNRIDEIIRLTVNVNSVGETLPTLLDILKEISRIQIQNGQKFSFFITEELPLISLANIVEQMTDKKIFLLSSSRLIGNDTLKTLKGFFVHEKLNQALSEVSFSEVAQSIFKQKKTIF